MLYILCLVCAFAAAFILTPLCRALAIKLGELDKPTEIKTHKKPTPLFGGVALFVAFTFTLLLVRFFTSFPTGTFHDLRIVLAGGFGMFLLGFIDDLKKPNGLDVKTKFIAQFIIAALTVYFGFGIKFLTPIYVASIISVFWVVGVSNALNLIDIMDGLSSSQIAIAALGFLIISFPSEAIYVNFASAALAGAALGFLPWNISRRYKIFMGDCGSLACGYTLAVIALGATYTNVNQLGVYAPLLVLAVPVFDTVFVSVLRMQRGMSPFKGSCDHFALRLEKKGFSRSNIVIIASVAGLIMVALAYTLTFISLKNSIVLLATTTVLIFLIAVKLSKIKI